MKILIFGGSGQLGYEINKRAKDLNFEVISPVESEVDICNLDQVEFLLQQVSPDLVINAAAYTNVEKAETQKDLVFNVNSTGAGNVARASKDIAKLVHLSTDYVFDGSASTPIAETAEKNPLSVYGASKAAGEEEVMRLYGENAIVLRTSSLHGSKGINFVNTMLDLFGRGISPNVINDQFMSPTWAGWLAEVVLDLGRSNSGGLIHASCSGAVTWFEFARAILQLAGNEFAGKNNIDIKPIPAAEYPTAVRRPAYSVMDCSKLAGILGREPIPWQEGLRQHLIDFGIKI